MTLHERIQAKLVKELTPAVLEISNESHKHAVPPNSETHFRVVVVCDRFEALGLVERHRLINSILADELRDGVHALAIQAHSPRQWHERGGQVVASPPCKGGSQAEGD